MHRPTDLYLSTAMNILVDITQNTHDCVALRVSGLHISELAFFI